ncbi:AAA family ATPase [Vibrio sp. 10N]|uniref:AAA family ATPase n=1 Tax=Vibrio sp. 10N TaxID=3058938 RepID=UPI002812E33B|nr:AAA family ATPase [Vibrio sp. 10N]
MSLQLPFIISGGPGSGKTTLLEALGELGHKTFPEIPRLLIEQQSQLDDGVLPWTQLGRFADMCFQEMIKQRDSATQSTQLIFVDRAIPDVCAYLGFGKLPVPDYIYSEANKGYQPIALFCKPTPETYVQDEVRPYPFEEALSIHQALYLQYQSLGFQVIEIPLMSVEQRVEFVLQLCQTHTANVVSKES